MNWVFWRIAVLAVALVSVSGFASTKEVSARQATPLLQPVHTIQAARANFAGERASEDACLAADWVVESADHQGLPFVIVDKKDARIFVFGADGKLRGSTPVLLGLAVSDKGLVDMSNRKVSSLRPDERSTPAGRFASEPGQNLQGEAIIWIDYESSIAIHRLRPDVRGGRRAQRLTSASIQDNRISMGCVVVPVLFYENVIQSVLGKSRSVVYVLPETTPLRAMLSALQAGLN